MKRPWILYCWILAAFSFIGGMVCAYAGGVTGMLTATLNFTIALETVLREVPQWHELYALKEELDMQLVVARKEV